MKRWEVDRFSGRSRNSEAVEFEFSVLYRVILFLYLLFMSVTVKQFAMKTSSEIA